MGTILISSQQKATFKIEKMYTIQIPKPMVLVFVALSSTLWFTTALLLSGLVYGEQDGAKVSLSDFMSSHRSPVTIFILLLFFFLSFLLYRVMCAERSTDHTEAWPESDFLHRNDQNIKN